jgi:PTS system nitrogen regulatory IIA component
MAGRRDSGRQIVITESSTAEANMKLLEFLPKEAVLADLKAQDKKGVLQELAAPVAAFAGVESHDLVQVLMERERLGTTGIGNGIGIPHGKMKHLKSAVIGFGLSRNGIDFESMDARPAHIFFLLAAPENSTELHLKMLARISKILKHDGFREKLMQAQDSDAIYAAIGDEDEDF